MAQLAGRCPLVRALGDDLRDVPITWQAAAALYESASSPCAAAPGWRRTAPIGAGSRRKHNRERPPIAMAGRCRAGPFCRNSGFGAALAVFVCSSHPATAPRARENRESIGPQHRSSDLPQSSGS